jgi:hypothetical protein
VPAAKLPPEGAETAYDSGNVFHVNQNIEPGQCAARTRARNCRKRNVS